MKLHSRISELLSLTAAAFLVTGCALVSTPTADPSAVQVEVGTIQGTVMGGRQPISNAKIYLYSASTSAYGGAATSLLTSGSGKDANNNYYVNTTAGGTFALSGTYTCTAGTQVYLYSIGGDPGAGVNSAAGLLAMLGNCPSTGGNFATQVPYLNVNEVTTIATAYALAGFAVDPTHIGSSGTTLAKTGILNAGANTTNLVNVGTGAALTVPSGGNGTVPQTKINSLANILAACINTAGPTSANCTTLFANTTIDGTSTGAKPTDTAAAAINIAHHPGLNVMTLFDLQATIPPFAPFLSTVPNDLTLSISFTGGGLAANPHLAIDSKGNVWSTSTGSAVVTKLSPLGAPLTGASGNTNSGLGTSMDIAIDVSDQAIAMGNGTIVTNFVTIPNTGTGGTLASALATPSSTSRFALDASSNRFFIDNSGTLDIVAAGGYVVSTHTGGGQTGGNNVVALDGAGAVWITSANNKLSKYSATGTAISGTGGYTGAGLSTPVGIAFDPSNDAFVANTNNSASAFSSTGSALTGTTGFTGGGMNKPVAIAVDGLDWAFIANATGNSVTELSATTGAAVTGTSGYTSPYLSTPYQLVLDGSGDVWVGNAGSANLVEFIGMAAPAITPLVAAVKAGTMAARP